MTTIAPVDEGENFDPPCPAIMYRAVKKRWVRQGQISHEVYLLDQIDPEIYLLRTDDAEPDGWETYISCNLADCEPEYYALHECLYKKDFVKPKKRGAVVSLHAGRVRNLALRVQTVEKKHIGIYDLPQPDQLNSEKLLAAENAARKLVSLSKWRWPIASAIADVGSHDHNEKIESGELGTG